MYSIVVAAVHSIDKKIAVILLLYFSISLTNIALKYEREWFPLFSFKLFSRVPGEFTRYDIVFDEGTPHERYLLHRTRDLNVLERHHYEHWLSSAATHTLDISGHEHLFEAPTTASLIRFSGDFVEAARDSKFRSEIVQVIK